MNRSGLRMFPIVVIMLISFGFMPAAAQSDIPPLLEMLSHVPNTPASRGETYFTDHRAIETAYPPAQMSTDWTAFKQLDAENASRPGMMPMALWWHVFMNTSTSQLSTFFAQDGDMPNAIGIDFFSIDRELYYGILNQKTLQLEGRFDLDGVRKALTARGYKLSDSGVELWCSPSGCDSGHQVNLADQNPANPFGGNLGRQQSVLMENGLLLSSPSTAMMDDHIAVAEGSLQSLADEPDYRAVVTALSQRGTILQAYFGDGDVLPALSQLETLTPLPQTPEQTRTLLQSLLPDYETLPPYELVVFADTVTDTEQAAQVVLVYSDATSVKQAVDIIPKRIASFQSLVDGRPWTDILKNRGVETVKAEVSKDAETGKYLAVFTLATPKATPEQILALTPNNPNPPTVTAPGLVFGLLMNAASHRDLPWLSMVTREDIEKYVNS